MHSPSPKRCISTKMHAVMCFTPLAHFQRQFDEMMVMSKDGRFQLRRMGELLFIEHPEHAFFIGRPGFYAATPKPFDDSDVDVLIGVEF